MMRKLSRELRVGEDRRNSDSDGDSDNGELSGEEWKGVLRGWKRREEEGRIAGERDVEE